MGGHQIFINYSTTTQVSISSKWLSKISLSNILQLSLIKKKKNICVGLNKTYFWLRNVILSSSSLYYGFDV